MHKPIKHRVGVYILLSLIPAVIIILTAVGLSGPDFDNTPFAVSAIGLLSVLYFMVAIISSPALILWGSIETKRTYRAAQRYAELNGWHPISRTTWRNRKRNQMALSVHQAFNKRTYILTIEENGETTTIDEFETPVWALQFGDWLWEQLLEVNTTPDKAEVAEKRAEWETTALAIIPHAPTLSDRGERWQMRPDILEPLRPHYSMPTKTRVTAALLAILLGSLGIHKFYLGHTGLGILYIVISILTAWMLAIPTVLVSIVEGVIYLSRSDEEFQYIYVQQRKSMF